MTPLQRLFSKRLCPRMVTVAMALTYALLLLGIVLSLGVEPPDILYVDVKPQGQA
jgi:predicted PurR-regulated permease PerM